MDQRAKVFSLYSAEKWFPIDELDVAELSNSKKFNSVKCFTIFFLPVMLREKPESDQLCFDRFAVILNSLPCLQHFFFNISATYIKTSKKLIQQFDIDGFDMRFHVDFHRILKLISIKLSSRGAE